MTPQTLRIYSLNVNGLNVDKALALHVELERLHIDIVLLQETHLLTDDHRIRQIERSLHPWQCYWGSALSQTSNQARPRQGVAILVRRRLLEQSYTFSPIMHDLPSRVLTGRFKGPGLDVRISSVYFPNTGSARDSDIQPCIRILKQQLENSQQVLWGGDYNFVSHQRDTTTNLHRAHPYRRTAKLWATAFDSTDICDLGSNTLRDRASYTHEHVTQQDPRCVTKSRLDRFYGSKQLEPLLKSITVQSIESSVVHTDHAAVILSLRRQTPITTPTKKAYRRRIPTQFRNDASILQNFRDECSQRFRPLARQDTISYKTWLDIKGTIARLSYSAQRKFRGKELEAVRQLREQEAAMSAFTSHQLQHRYAHVDHQPNAEQQWDADTESHAMPLTPYRYSTTDYRLQDSHQQLQGDSTACANILIDHYADISQQEILSEEIQEEILHSLTPADQTVFPAQAFPDMITEQDVRNAIKRMKPTAAGLDGIKIVTAFLKDSLAPILAKVFTGLLHDMPQSFLEGLIIPIYKKGPRYQAINYRPITLLNTDYRIFTQILLAKLKGPLQQLSAPHRQPFCQDGALWTKCGLSNSFHSTCNLSRNQPS
eukprot:jgi/Picre1/27075/NNA_000045.t1